MWYIKDRIKRKEGLISRKRRGKMSLERSTQYGKIKLNDTIFAKAVLSAVAKTGGKVLCASERGKILGGIDQNVSTGELT